MSNQNSNQHFGGEMPSSLREQPVPQNARTYSNSYNTDAGRTNVNEKGYVAHNTAQGVNTTTTYNETTRTTRGDPVELTTLHYGSDAGRGSHSNRTISSQGYQQQGQQQTQNYNQNQNQQVFHQPTNYQTNSYQTSSYQSNVQPYSTTTINRISGSERAVDGERRLSSHTRLPNNYATSSSNLYNATSTSQLLQPMQQSTYQSGSNRLTTAPITSNEGRASLYNGRRQSYIEKESYLVEEHVHEPRVVEVREGEKRVIEIREGELVTTKETVTQGESRVVREVELQGVRQESTRREARREEKDVEIVQRQKIIEVLKEKPVKVERVVEVRYDVIVDIPIERTIEREMFIDVLVERPIEKIVEVPYEQIIEIPVEKIIERPVEIQKFVETPFERIVEKPYEVIRENVQWNERIIDIDERDIRKYPSAQVLPTSVDYQHKDKMVDRPYYVDNIIEKEVRVPVERFIEVPKEVIVERRVPQIISRPYPVEKIVTREVEMQVENVVHRDVEHLIERAVYVDNIIEKPVPVERIIDKEIEVEVEHIVEKPVYIDKIIERQVEHIVQVPVAVEELIEVPIEQIIETPFSVERVIERPVEKIIRKSVPVIKQVQIPVEYLVEKTVEKKVDRDIEVVINRYVEIPVEKIIEKPVYIERTVERPKIVERIVEVPIERIIENIQIVEKIIEKPVYINTVVEREVEVIVEKEVQVPVEKIVEVEVEVLTERPVYREVIIEEEVFIDTEVDEVNNVADAPDNVMEHDDNELTQEIDIRKSELDRQRGENNSLRARFDSLQKEFVTLRSKLSSADEQDNVQLRSTYEELMVRLRVVREQKSRLIRKSHSRSYVTETVLNKDPRYDVCRQRLKSLISENQSLVNQITNKGEFVRKSLRRSTYNIN